MAWPARPTTLKAKVRFQYFFDTQLMGDEGDGTDVDPWSSISTGLQEISDRASQEWKAGQ